jgi:putative ABC transport system permease protein
VDALWRDVRYALRTLRRSPALAFSAAVSVALGIGANTVIFTLIHTLFLNPLPVDKSAELVALYTLDTRNTTGFGNVLPLSYPNLVDFRDRNTTFAELTGYSFPMPLSFSMGEAPERVFAQLVTGNYFDVLGLRPAAGRFFRSDEDQTPGRNPVVVIGHGFWQRRFGGDRAMVGQTIALNRSPFTIVGVAPQGFKGVTSIFGPDLWVPTMMAAQLTPDSAGDWLHDRGASVLTGAARLKPNVTMAQARANLESLAVALEREYPKPNAGRTVSLEPLTAATLFPGMRGPMIFGGLVLMTVVGLVLLIACSNVASLMLARAMARRQEIAIRLTVGASRARLVRQMLTEGLVLSLLGGALGIVLGAWGRNVLWSFRPAAVAQNFVELKMDVGVFVFALVLSLVSGVVFALVPALRASRADVVGALKGDDTLTRRHGGRRVRFRDVLVIGQVTLSLLSLIVAALFLRSIQRAYAIDVGYDTKALAVLTISPGQGGYDRPRGEQFYRDVRQRVSTIPGVTSVSWAANQPLWASGYRRVFLDDGGLRDELSAPLTLVNPIDTGYFATTGIRIVRGRDFMDTDRDASVLVAIINETMASKYWPQQDPIGRRFRFEPDGAAREVVGVVKTVKYQAIGEAPQPCVYVPLRQNYSQAMVLYVRGAGDATSVLTTVEREVRNLDRQVPVENVASVDQVIDQSLWMVKLGAGLLSVFGVLALALSSVGLYGTIAYLVRQRQREMGVRMALGAHPGVVRWLVLRQGMTLVIAGLSFGLGASWLAGRGLSTMLYGLSATDPVAFTGATLVLIAIAFVAISIPAYRASRLDPLVALREP